MDESDPLMINLLSSKASRESALTPSEMPTNIKIVSGQKNRQLNKGRNDEPYLLSMPSRLAEEHAEGQFIDGKFLKTEAQVASDAHMLI